MRDRRAEKKKPGVVSKVRSGLRKLSLSADSAKSSRLQNKKPVAEEAKKKYSGETSKSEGEDSDVLPSKEHSEDSPMGFFSLLDDREKSTLASKAPRNIGIRRAVELPSLIMEISSLLSIFPNCDRNTIPTLLCRYEGNCREIYDFLLSENHLPAIDHSPAIFTNEPDVHYTTEYYHGEAPSKEELAQMFEDKESGTYLTCYRGSADFQYLLCFKNILGCIAEKPIRGPVVPVALVHMLDLGDFIKAPAEPKSLPCLYSTLRDEQL